MSVTRIYQNPLAINANRNLKITGMNISKSLERLSSGLRINRAADDAAGLTISEKLRSQIRGLNRASTNALDGISLIQTAEGALNETHSILQRMRELSVQAANGIYTANDRQAIQSEVGQLIDEINLSGAQILFVALGSPKQELWMEQYLPELQHIRVCQGVGGTFDVIAGRVRRAPALFRRFHLEWFYRLITDPRRAIRQVALPQFTLAVFRAKLSSRS